MSVVQQDLLHLPLSALSITSCTAHQHIRMKFWVGLESPADGCSLICGTHIRQGCKHTGALLCSLQVYIHDSLPTTTLSAWHTAPQHCVQPAHVPPVCQAAHFNSYASWNIRESSPYTSSMRIQPAWILAQKSAQGYYAFNREQLDFPSARIANSSGARHWSTSIVPLLAFKLVVNVQFRWQFYAVLSRGFLELHCILCPALILYCV
jgi:hypothetical protein